MDGKIFFRYFKAISYNSDENETIIYPITLNHYYMENS